MEINEKIVITWLEECKQMFTMNNIYYGQNNSDIDILAVDMKNKEIWNCEVKVRTVPGSKISDPPITKTNGHSNFSYIVDSMLSEKRNQKISEFINSDFKLVKKFITTRSFFNKPIESKKDKWEEKFNDKGIEVIYFDDIILELNELSKKTNKTSNELLQILKLLNIVTKTK